MENERARARERERERERERDSAIVLSLSLSLSLSSRGLEAKERLHAPLTMSGQDGLHTLAYAIGNGENAQAVA